VEVHELTAALKRAAKLSRTFASGRFGGVQQLDVARADIDKHAPQLGQFHA